MTNLFHMLANRRLFLSLGLWVLTLAWPLGSAKASHILGGEITYRCLGTVSLNLPSKSTGTATVFHGPKPLWPCRVLTVPRTFPSFRVHRMISLLVARAALTYPAILLPRHPTKTKARSPVMCSEASWISAPWGLRLRPDTPSIPPRLATVFLVAAHRLTTARRITDRRR